MNKKDPTTDVPRETKRSFEADVASAHVEPKMTSESLQAFADRLIETATKIDERQRLLEEREAKLNALLERAEKLQEPNAMAIAPRMYVPPPPAEVQPPTHWEIELEPINRNVDLGGDPYSTFKKKVPDLFHYCYFCTEDVTAGTGWQKKESYTQEEKLQLDRYREEHIRYKKSLATSKDIQEKRAAADHTELRIREHGIRKATDEVWYMGRAWTTEEWNARKQGNYKNKLINLSIHGVTG